MIEIHSLAYSHPNNIPIFQDFNWQVGQGETWAVLGPSGCGKTTLLYLLAGLRNPTIGYIRIGGEQITRPRPQTGLILQDYGLLPWATVRQNAGLGLRIRDFYGPDGTHAPSDHQPEVDADPWLERLGLTPICNKYPGQISGGQRQRTAIARTLALRPDLLLMDEPFASLDAPTRENLQSLTLELCNEEKLTLVLVTHAIEEAAVLGQKILLLATPPNIRVNIIENPGASDPEFRKQRGFPEICQHLRQSMEASG
jgi:ABC-type nitrate/sulfonate/bicarbonate transport system ATPase subunit